MNFFKSIGNFFNTSNSTEIEKKSDGITNLTAGEVFLSPFSAGGTSFSLLRFYQSWKYYTKISPIFDAVERKQKAVKTVEPCIYDHQEEIYIKKVNPRIPATLLLDFLKKPNRDITWLEFIEAIVPSIDVTGNIFILVTSINEESRPLEFYYINPLDMNFINGSDGRVYCWQLRSKQFNEDFYYHENPKKGINSYFTKDGMKELWQIKTFNPFESAGDPYGISPLNAIFKEIEQYEYSNINNISLLKRGVRPSGVLVIDKEFELTDEQYNRMKSQIQLNKGGAENSGDVLILEGGKDFKQLSMSNKDMEFMELIKFVKDQIYITKGIPLPMISGASMTMNNFEESKYMMFDTEILPFMDKFYQDINNLFMRRFDQSGRYDLCYNPETIPALKVKITESNERKIKSGAITLDESRNLLGYEPRPNNEGNVILINSTQKPLGQIEEESTDVQGKSYDYTTPAGRYRYKLESIVDESGEQKYTDEMIDQKVKFLYPGIK